MRERAILTYAGGEQWRCSHLPIVTGTQLTSVITVTYACACVSMHVCVYEFMHVCMYMR